MAYPCKSIYVNINFTYLSLEGNYCPVWVALFYFRTCSERVLLFNYITVPYKKACKTCDN